MPELPEVEVIRRELEPLVGDKIFATPRLLFPGSVRFPAPNEFIDRLPGCRIRSLQRRGKYLIFQLSRGLLLVHLRMTGRLLFSEEGVAAPEPTHLRVVLPFQEGGALNFYDMRKFGGLWLSPGRRGLPPGFLKLGPDLYREVDRERFAALLGSHRRARLKSLLLNQRVFSGLGNIYTDESLYRSRLHPRRPAGSLTPKEIDSLYRAISRLLKRGIRYGGTSIRGFRGATDREGSFQDYLEVYGRRDKPCRRCGTPILRITVGGRGTYLCPRCQPEDSSPTG